MKRTSLSSYLLNKVRGAESFNQLKSVDGVLHPTFKLSRIALGLLQDDNELDLALNEASLWASSVQLTNMFCTMLLYYEVLDPKTFWERHWISLTDDIVHRFRREISTSTMNVNDEELKNLGLLELKKILNKNGWSLHDYLYMPWPLNETTAFSLHRLIREKLDYDQSVQTVLFQNLHPGSNADQLHAFNSIVFPYENKTSGLYFVYGSGGTGKTYLWRTLIFKFRSKNEIVLFVASSDISASLLPRGRTTNSCFKIPLNPDDSTTCNINYNSDASLWVRSITQNDA